MNAQNLVKTLALKGVAAGMLIGLPRMIYAADVVVPPPPCSNWRCPMKRLRMSIAVMAGLLATANLAQAADDISALLTGYEETPAAVSTTGRGTFRATISDDGQSINYTLTYHRLQAP